MQTFDKLKIVASIDTIEILNENAFEKVEHAGGVISLKYYQEKPFLLIIKVDLANREVVIEFSGKILGRDYPQLISLKTISKCFQNINDLHICYIDAEAIMEGEVVKADYTKDIKGVDTTRLANFIQGHLCNYKAYQSRLLRNGNLIIEKNVVSKEYKIRMTIYDKQKEMCKTTNKAFIQDNHLEGCFNDTCRVEMNLNSKEQVRKALKISDNSLKSVLMSEANPIVDFLNTIIVQEKPRQAITSMKSYQTELVLKDCNYDLQKVEAKIRSLYPNRGVSIKNKMKPYRAMMAQITPMDEVDYWQDILNELR